MTPPTVARAVVTFTLMYLLNYFRDRQVELRWQIIIVLGGVRGAMNYAMVACYARSGIIRLYSFQLFFSLLVN